MIVLTGGAGFIGSCFLQKLNSKNISNVLVVDRLGDSEKWKNLVGKKFIRYEHKDIFRKKLDNGDYGKDIDAIVHLGACSVTTEKNADYMLDNNFTYSTELAEYAEWNEIKFIYASSAATYGNGENGYSDEEFDSLKPLNIYGYSKHLFDQWVIKYGLESRFTGLKFFNVFGPNEYHKADMASMVYKSFRQIETTGRVHLFKSYDENYKDGEQMRDFVYVKDVVEIMWKIFDSDKMTGIYNLGTRKANNWNSLVNAVFAALGKDPEIEYIDMPDSLQKQYQYFTEAEMSKLDKTGIGLEFSSLEDTVADYVKEHLVKDWKYF